MKEEDYWIKHTDDLEAIEKQLRKLNEHLDRLIDVIVHHR
jgi:hypothetical protein